MNAPLSRSTSRSPLPIRSRPAVPRELRSCGVKRVRQRSTSSMASRLREASAPPTARRRVVATRWTHSSSLYVRIPAVDITKRRRYVCATLSGENWPSLVMRTKRGWRRGEWRTWRFRSVGRGSVQAVQSGRTQRKAKRGDGREQFKGERRAQIKERRARATYFKQMMTRCNRRQFVDEVDTTTRREEELARVEAILAGVCRGCARRVGRNELCGCLGVRNET